MESDISHSLNKPSFTYLNLNWFVSLHIPKQITSL